MSRHCLCVLYIVFCTRPQPSACPVAARTLVLLLQMCNEYVHVSAQYTLYTITIQQYIYSTHVSLWAPAWSRCVAAQLSGET